MADETKDNRAAQALRAFLKRTETTQNQLAARAGISQAQLSRLTRGEKCLVDRKQGLALREHAGIELEWWDEPPVAETQAPTTDREAPTGTEG